MASPETERPTASGTPATTDWLELAACAGMDTAMFFDPARQAQAEALAVCATCAVTAECLADALAWPAEMDYGIRGGLSRWDRHSSRHARVTLADGCGTPRGYLRHRRAGELACGACRDAEARYRREQRRERREQLRQTG